MGVIAPSHFTFVTASRYSEPEKITMPRKKESHGPLGTGFCRASQNSMMVWMK